MLVTPGVRPEAGIGVRVGCWAEVAFKVKSHVLVGMSGIARWALGRFWACNLIIKVLTLCRVI